MSKKSCSISDLFLPMLSNCHYICTDCSDYSGCIITILNNKITCDDCDKELRSESGKIIMLYISYKKFENYENYIFHGDKYYDTDYNNYKNLCLKCFKNAIDNDNIDNTIQSAFG